MFHSIEKQMFCKLFDNRNTYYLYSAFSIQCVVPENIHTPPHGGSRKFQGVEGCERGKSPKGKVVYKELFFPEGWKWDQIKQYDIPLF